MLQVFLLTLFVILCLILIGRALQLREMLFGMELSLAETGLLFVYLTPTFVQLAAPISCMIAIFIVYLRLENDREMTAVRAAGISLYQIIPAPICLAFLVMCATLAVSLYGISWGMMGFRDTLLDVASNKAKIVVQPGIFNKEIPGFVLYAKNVDPLSGLMTDVVLQTNDEQKDNDNNQLKRQTTILSPEGNINIDRNNGQILFLLKNGKIYSAEQKQSTVLNFREYIVTLPLNVLFKGLDLGPVAPKEMSFNQLISLDYVSFIGTNNRMAYKILIERHKRIVFPFACFVLGLLAIPIAAACSGIKKQQGLGVALLIFMVYYGFLSVGISIGEKGQLNPYLGIWLPNLFFFLLALFGINYYAKACSKG